MFPVVLFYQCFSYWFPIFFGTQAISNPIPDRSRYRGTFSSLSPACPSTLGHLKIWRSWRWISPSSRRIRPVQPLFFSGVTTSAGIRFSAVTITASHGHDCMQSIPGSLVWSGAWPTDISRGPTRPHTSKSWQKLANIDEFANVCQILDGLFRDGISY